MSRPALSLRSTLYSPCSRGPLQPFHDCGRASPMRCTQPEGSAAPLEPTTAESRASQSSDDCRATSHDVPRANQSGNSRSSARPALIDAEVIRNDQPTTGRAIRHGKRLIERRPEPIFLGHPKSIRAKCRTVGMRISGAHGSEATTTHGATVPSSGPSGAPRGCNRRTRVRRRRRHACTSQARRMP